MATTQQFQDLYDEQVAAGNWENAQTVADSYAEQNPGKSLQLAERPPDPTLLGTAMDKLGRAKDYIDEKTTEFAEASVDVWPSVFQGATLGFGDELAALLGSAYTAPGKQPELYRELLEGNRDLIERTTKRSPAWTTAADFAGGMISPANFLVPGAGPGTSLTRTLGREALEGGLQGALEAFGRSEGSPLEQAGAAGTGSAWGAALQPAFASAMRMGGLLVDPVMSLARRAGLAPDEVAEEQVGRLLQAGGESPERVAERLEDLGPTSMLADLDRQTAEMTAAARARSDAAGRIIDPALEARQAGQPERVRGLLREAAGSPALPQDISLTQARRTALDQARKKYNQRFYSQLSEQTVTMDDDLRDTVQTPYVQNLLKDAKRGWLSENRLAPTTMSPYDRMMVDPQTGQMVGGDFRLSEMNEIKILMDDRALELDDRIKQGVATGGEKAEAYRLGELRDALKENLDKQAPAAVTGPRRIFPGYPSVRAGYEDIAKRSDALEAGRALNRTAKQQLDDLYERVMGVGERRVTDPRRVAAGQGSGRLAGYKPQDAMTENQRRVFREGALDAMTEEVNRPGGELADRAGRLLRGEDARRRLELMSVSPEANARLQEQLAGEMQQYQTLQMVSPRTGSRTAVLEAAGERYDEEIGKMRDTMGMASGEPGTMSAAAFNTLKRELGNPEVAEEIARIMVNPNVTVDDINRLMQGRNIPETTRERVMRFMESELGRALSRAPARQAAGVLAQ